MMYEKTERSVYNKVSTNGRHTAKAGMTAVEIGTNACFAASPSYENYMHVNQGSENFHRRRRAFERTLTFEKLTFSPISFASSATQQNRKSQQQQRESGTYRKSCRFSSLTIHERRADEVLSKSPAIIMLLVCVARRSMRRLSAG